LQHEHQHAVPDIGQRISKVAPVLTPLLLLPLELQLIAVYSHLNIDRISSLLLAQPIFSFCHVELLDTQ
jgi:hypothetical protein